ncbi:MAG: N-acetylglucosamine-6-phosphate deacetylase [Acidimicrobiales bacterium]
MNLPASHLIYGGDVLTPAGWQEFDLNIVDGLISGGTEGPGEVVDASGLKIVPGFIDLQINGGWGHDLQRDPASMWALAARLVEVGVTSFLPTLTTNGYSRRREALNAWRSGPPADGDLAKGGADAIGWHIEGPWLAPSKHGAHSRELLQRVPDAVPEEYTPAGGVRLVTLAPELSGATSMVDGLTHQGVVVSVGHSEATADEARAAFEAGATMGTHLFNAMSGIHHRHVGLAAALLVEPVYVGMILDGFHVAADVVRLAWRLAGNRMIAVSDAVAFMGTAAASPTDAVRLYDGTLAGSSIGLDTAIRNLMTFTGCMLGEALATVTEIPATCLGLTDRGRIEVGRRADLVALDAEHRVVLTFVGGRLLYDAR